MWVNAIHASSPLLECKFSEDRFFWKSVFEITNTPPQTVYKNIFSIVEHLESTLKFKEENKNLPVNPTIRSKHCWHLGLFSFKLYLFSYKFRIIQSVWLSLLYFALCRLSESEDPVFSLILEKSQPLSVGCFLSNILFICSFFINPPCILT